MECVNATLVMLGRLATNALPTTTIILPVDFVHEVPLAVAAGRASPTAFAIATLDMLVPAATNVIPTTSTTQVADIACERKPATTMENATL